MSPSSERNLTDDNLIIGEGGYAFVYEAADMDNPIDRKYALKRLIAHDQEKRKLIVQEISILK